MFKITLYRNKKKIIRSHNFAGIWWSIVYKSGHSSSSSGQSVDGEVEGEEQGSFFLDFSFPIMGEEDN